MSRRLLYVVLAGIVIGVLMRWAYPSSDPPLYRQTGAPWWNESAAHDARNGAMWGAWIQDDWRPGLIAPVYTAVTEQSLRLFGVSYFALRLPAMICGTLLVLLAFAQARATGLSRDAGLISAMVIAASWPMVGFSKVAIMEPITLLCVSTLVLLLLIAARSKRLATVVFFVAGLAGGLTVVSKISSASIVGITGAYSLFGPCPWGCVRPWLARFTRTASFGAGVVLAGLSGFYVWILPNWAAYQDFVLTSTVLDRQKTSLLPLALNAISVVDSQILLAIPFFVVPVCLLSVRLASRMSAATYPLRFGFGLLTTVLAGGVLTHLNFDVPPQRLVWVTVYIAILFGLAWDFVHDGLGLDASATTNVVPIVQRVLPFLNFVLCVIAGLVVAGWVISPNGGLLALISPTSAAWLMFTMKAKVAVKVVWLLLGLACGIGLLVFQQRLYDRRREIVRWALCAQVVLLCVCSGLWLFRRSETLVTTSRAIEQRVGSGTYVAGALAVPLAFANTTRPLYWYPGGVRYASKDEDAFDRRFHPEYVLTPEPTLQWYSLTPITSTPFFDLFKGNEVERYTIYELHACPELSGYVYLLRRAPSGLN